MGFMLGDTVPRLETHVPTTEQTINASGHCGTLANLLWIIVTSCILQPPLNKVIGEATDHHTSLCPLQCKC